MIGEKNMKLGLISFEDIFNPEKIITSSEIIEKGNNKDGKKKFSKDGIFSEEIFGEANDPNNIEIQGWIDFDSYYFISPIGYKKLYKVFKGNLLNEMISFNKETDKDGLFVEEEKKNEFSNIGLVKFQENFLKILDKYGNKEKSEYQSVLDMYNENKLFINKIPVFSPKIRPALVLNNTIISDSINRYYTLLAKYNNEIHTLDDETEEDYGTTNITRLHMLGQIQECSNSILEEIIVMLSGKKGVLRKNIIGVRINNSSRNVIVPKAYGPLNTVDLPYQTFLGLYEFLIINLMSKTEGILVNKAKDYIQQSKTHFDKKIYNYMMELKDKSIYGLKVLINRNPTINLGSIMSMGIDNIKDDYSDLTMSIPNSILAPMGADFDGDVLNIIPLFTTKHKNVFNGFEPHNLMISYNNGKFNREFSLDKDEKIGFYNLNN